MFCNNIDQEHLAVLTQVVESMNSQTQKEELNVIVDEISNLFINCSKKSVYKKQTSYKR